jgi:hypothetical protein
MPKFLNDVDINAALTVADIPIGATNIILGATSSGRVVQANNNIRHYSIGLGVSANGIITTGAKTRKTISVAGTITGYRLVSDVTTNAVVDIWIRGGGSIPTNAQSITASAKPTLTAAEHTSSTTLTGWTTAVTSTSIIIIEVESNSAANYLYLELYMDITI